MGEMMENKTCFVAGVEYESKQDQGHTCLGCAGNGGGGGLCRNLGFCGNAIWVRKEAAKAELTLKRLPHFLTLYVPTHKCSRRHETGLIQAAGGLTCSYAVGKYTMADGSNCADAITKVTVFCDDMQKSDVAQAAREYIVHLLDSGEESVLVESSAGTGLFTKETL